MSTHWTGTLRFHDLGAGAWTLSLDDGRRLALYGRVDHALDGARVVVTGRAVDAMGFGPAGDGAVEVETVARAR